MPAPKRSTSVSSDGDDDDDQKPSRPRKRARTANAKTFAEPTRRSTRLVENASKEEHTQLPDNWDESSVSNAALRRRHNDAALRIRQLPAPDFPEPKEEDLDFDPSFRAPLPTRDSAEDNSGYGKLRFADAPHFTPNLTPEEMMRLGSFGGTYWRPFDSRILRKRLVEDFSEYPPEWTEGIDKERYLCSNEYDNEVNQYGVRASQTIEQWEDAGWIRPQDPRGWTQWYCRFYLGRRTPDDERQIRRMLNAVGPRGRFKTGLAKSIAAAGGAEQWNNYDIAPVSRQTLQHWATRITREDMLDYLSAR